jgi:hypothetical protein
MASKSSSRNPSRRQFLLNILPVGTLLCLGSSHLLALSQSVSKTRDSSVKHKFLEDSEMSFKDVFRFTFQNYYIPCIQRLSDEIGREKLIEMLKRLTSEAVAESVKKSTENLPNNDFATYVALSEERKNRFVEHVLTAEVLKETESEVRTNITECLWAETFREAEAADIGYAAICYPDFASASAFNPKIKLVRTKTLMQGHECCNFHYIWEG